MNQYDHFKDKLHGYKVKIDKDKLWQQTAHAIPQRKRRRIILLFLVGSLGLASLWLSYTPFHTTLNASFTSTDNPIESITAHEESIPRVAIASTNEGADPEPKVGKPQKTKPNHYSFASEQFNIKNAEQEKSIPANLDVVEADLPVITNAELENNQAISTSSRAPTVRDFLVITRENNPSSSSAVTNHTRLMIEATPPLQNPAVPFPNELNSIDLSSAEVPVIPAAKSRNRISFSLIGAIGISSLHIRALNNESSETAELLNRNIRSLEHLSVNVSGSLPLTRNIIVEGRLGWNQWTTETRHHTTSYEPLTREGITSIVIDEDGARQTVTGLVNGVQVLHKDLVRFTQYQSMEAELALHKVLWRHHRTSLGAYAAGTFVISDHASGSAFDTEWELQRFSRKDNPFVRKSEFGFGAGATLNYQFYRHLRFSGTISYQPVKYLWRDDQQQIEWKHSTVRSQLGISYLLN